MHEGVAELCSVLPAQNCTRMLGILMLLPIPSGDHFLFSCFPHLARATACNQWPPDNKKPHTETGGLTPFLFCSHNLIFLKSAHKTQWTLPMVTLTLITVWTWCVLGWALLYSQETARTPGCQHPLTWKPDADPVVLHFSCCRL